VLLARPLTSHDGTAEVPNSLVNVSLWSKQTLVADESRDNLRFATDPYIAERQTRSAMA
jgi:hypothetical protein